MPYSVISVLLADNREVGARSRHTPQLVCRSPGSSLPSAAIVDRRNSLLDQAVTDHAATRKAWGDARLLPSLGRACFTRDADMDSGPHAEARRLIPIPKRWAAERTNGWLMFHRRVALD